MKSVEVDDGHSGDGTDVLITNFDHQEGYYSRLERDFYGYRTVVG